MSLPPHVMFCPYIRVLLTLGPYLAQTFLVGVGLSVSEPRAWDIKLPYSLPVFLHLPVPLTFFFLISLFI